MPFKALKLAMMAGVTLVWSSFGASASLISQDVTFTFTELNSTTLQLTIDNVLNANGNWAPVQFLDGFDIRNVGSFSSATATYVSNSQSESGQSGKQINNSGVGCSNGGGASSCFDWTPNLTLTNHMVFDISFVPTGSGLDFAQTQVDGGTTHVGPHLKIGFLTNTGDSKETGDLLSTWIPLDPQPVPGPMVGAGLPGLLAVFGMFGLSFWRRRQQLA